MATKIPKDMLDHIVRTPPRASYNWENYDDGDWWQLRRGEDYHGQTGSARQSAGNWARSHGRRAETALLKESDGFALRFAPN